jgi:DNA-binding NtrC family response regulator
MIAWNRLRQRGTEAPPEKELVMTGLNGQEISASVRAIATVFATAEDCRWIGVLLQPDEVEVVAMAGLEEACQALAPMILLDADNHVDWAFALRHLVEMNPTSRVIVMARQADNRMWVEALSQGAHDLLRKPLSSSEFRSAVLGVLQTETLLVVRAAA